MKVGVLGAGAWGTALASLLSHNGHDVLLWAHEQSVVQGITDTHQNRRYLPGIILSDNVQATQSVSEFMQHADVCFIAVPVAFLRDVLQQCTQRILSNMSFVVTCKGIEQQTLLLPTQIIAQVCAQRVQTAVVSGPSFAYDLAHKQITGLVVAAQQHAVAQFIAQFLQNDYCKTSLSSDVTGVQLAGALKNVLALGVGILDGAGYTDNTKAYFFTQVLQEIVQLGVALGAQVETFYTLAGVGDMVLTAMGKLSKNLAVGRSLGKGESLDAILQRTGFVPEGINTVHSLNQLMKKQQIDMPRCRALYQVIFKQALIESLFKV